MSEEEDLEGGRQLRREGLWVGWVNGGVRRDREVERFGGALVPPTHLTFLTSISLWLRSSLVRDSHSQALSSG